MTITTLGKYELLELLGEGATSEVYRARDTALDREVAFKVLKPALVTDASAFERFAKEARAAAGLFHPNIATVLDMGAANGRYFIAMRYFPGQSLDKILKSSGPLSWEETLRLAQQIGSALDYAHEQGFLHRDVKPANIIRTPKGEFILTDFGLTRAMMSTGLTSHTGAVLGTPAYIAPEIWNGQAAVPSTDQYALACVVCESLTGQVLFAGDTPPAVMTRHMLKGPELPASWPPGVPDGLSDALRKALASKPEERYPSVSTFSAACANLLADIQKAEQERLAAAEQAARDQLERERVVSAVQTKTPRPTHVKDNSSKKPLSWKTLIWFVVFFGVFPSIGQWFVFWLIFEMLIELGLEVTEIPLELIAAALSIAGNMISGFLFGVIILKPIKKFSWLLTISLVTVWGVIDIIWAGILYGASLEFMSVSYVILIMIGESLYGASLGIILYRNKIIHTVQSIGIVIFGWGFTATIGTISGQRLFLAVQDGYISSSTFEIWYLVSPIMISAINGFFIIWQIRQAQKERMQAG